MTFTDDIRPTAWRYARVGGGVLYLRREIVQVWWDDNGKETWTAPTAEQALENYLDMVDRWSTKETA
jgi:hypothetical protein